MIKVYKTLITVEVLHKEHVDFKNLRQVAYEITEGSASGLVSIGPRVAVPPEQLTAECDRHGTDIEWFIDPEDEESAHA